jgi:C-terminal processing protease CtpA/Prc
LFLDAALCSIRAVSVAYLRPRVPPCRLAALLCALVSLVGCLASPVAAQDATWEAWQIENLQAFARLYGQIRFFHPSEAVSEVDWNTLAVFGAGEMLKASPAGWLRRSLETMFLPLAPTLRLYGVGEAAPDPTADWPPRDDLLTAAWQHRGFGFGEVDLYRSARVLRPRDPLLFDVFPELGEVVDRELGGGLRAVSPLVLLSDGERTYGGRRPDAVVVQDELEILDPVANMGAYNVNLRLGTATVAWNVLRHFYPYSVDADWDALLVELLESSLDAGEERAFYRELKRLAARLDDGQADVAHARLDADRSLPPVAVGWIEDRVVVTASEADGVAAGDVVVRVDRIPAEDLVREQEELVSGSPQRQRARALATFAVGQEGTLVRLALERGGKPLEAEVRRDRREPLEPPARPAVDKLENGVYYVDLRRVHADRIREMLPELAAAPGVVFDLRGEAAGGSHTVLHHIIGEPVLSAPWSVPGVIRPDGEQVTWLDLDRWRLEPREPRLAGRAVFLADARAVGYAESILSIVEHYRLGDVVGRATAGADGTVNAVTLPGSFRLTYTGTRVLRHDGSRFHGLGVEPTVPVAVTMVGVREGRDEDLEKALERVGRH